MIETVTLESVTYNTPPHRFEAGTPPIAQAVGLGAALDYMERIGRDAIREYEAGLTAYAHQRLSQIEGLRIYGQAPDKGPILSFDMAAAHAHDIATVIDRSGIAVRAGNALRHAATFAFGRHLHLSRILRALQHARGDRPAGGGARKGPLSFRLRRISCS